MSDKRNKYFTIIFLSVFIVALLLNFNLQITDVYKILSSVFFTDSTSTLSLKQQYNSSSPIKILIVPGHDEVSWGTKFKNSKESDVTLAIGQELYNFFKNEDKIEAILYRDSDGYNEEISGYFEKNRSSIEKFVQEKKEIMNNLMRSGDIFRIDGVSHNPAPIDTAYRLYGINKWANENNIDLIIHVHLNDYSGRKLNKEGKYSGFSIYVPESQYSNAKASRDLADHIFSQLDSFYNKSNLAKENSGVVPDQELIALGAYNTLDSVGILIEYGYIYEPQFNEFGVDKRITKDMAYQTYLGVINFFDLGKYSKEYWKTTLLPIKWQRTFGLGSKGEDVLSLQAALSLEGLYPPSNFNKDDCPITGAFKMCTFTALKDFQNKYGITPTGEVGKVTLKKLNEIYSSTRAD